VYRAALLAVSGAGERNATCGGGGLYLSIGCLFGDVSNASVFLSSGSFQGNYAGRGEYVLHPSPRLLTWALVRQLCTSALFVWYSAGGDGGGLYIIVGVYSDNEDKGGSVISTSVTLLDVHAEANAAASMVLDSGGFGACVQRAGSERKFNP
jgi:hypothetical protein